LFFVSSFFIRVNENKIFIWHNYCILSLSGQTIYFIAPETMSKINGITDLIEAGIKAEGLRQKAIASNVANIQTPGYRRFEVKFGEILEKALSSDGNIDSEELEPEIFQPLNTAVNASGNDVNLEVEVGQMVENSIRHKAYTRLLAKKYRQIELAIGG
jgi:flagellar basal-body rod protein FlgB